MNIELLITNTPAPELLTAPIPHTLPTNLGWLPRVGEEIYLDDLKWRSGANLYLRVTKVLHGLSDTARHKVRIEAILLDAEQ